MLSIAAVSSSQALTYFAANYYEHGATNTSTRWNGRGAEMLGLSGGVTRKAFASLLYGRMPDGTQLGRAAKDTGEIEHLAGWDLTFSAPKSVSVMATAGGDERLVQAHREACAEALAYVEKLCATVRISVDKIHSKEHTNNLTIASFSHIDSRDGDMDIHDHNVVLNCTQDAAGEWRSVGSPADLFYIKMEAGELYRSILAGKVRELGYMPQIERTKNGILFEISEVPTAVCEKFSKRSQAIVAYLEARGLTRETATREQKQEAQKATSSAKSVETDEQFQARWKEELRELGAELHIPLSPGKVIDADAEARKAVAFALAKLPETNSVFSLKDLTKEAESFAFSKASKQDIAAAIEAAKADGKLLDRHVIGAESQLTTPATIKDERDIIANALSGVGKMQPVMNSEDANRVVADADAASRTGGHGVLNKGQAETLHGLLTSSDQIVLIQGYAGTAKTNAVLANYSKALTEQGHTVLAMAPTASAASTLGDAIKADSKTMQSALMSLHASFVKGEAPKPNQVWMLDEASLASTRDLAALTKLASWADAKLILTGDTKQLSSVEAGQGFKQLQESGIKTLVLDEIVRQKNDFAKGAVYDSIAGDAAAALSKIDKSGEVKEIVVLDEKTGKIDQVASRQARVESISKDYASQTREQRADSIIVAPGRDDREQINTRVRELLHNKGELGENHAATVLEPRGLGKAEAREAQFYTPGDLVTFRKDYVQKGVIGGDYLTVKKVDTESNTITLQSKTGKELEWNPRMWGASSATSFAPVGKEMAVGDTVKITKNDKTLEVNNGDTATITQIKDGKMHLDMDGSKKTLTLDINNPAHQHLAHAYAQTAFAAQGRTAKNVFVHAESHRSNLLNQQSFYVGISRATDRINVYTDNKDKLVSAINERTGAKITALDLHPVKTPEVEIEKLPEPEIKKEREAVQLER